MKRSLFTLALMLLSVAAQSQAIAADAGPSFFALAGNSGVTTVSLLAAGLIALGLARHRAK